jgi:hypothetical protein
MDEYEELEQLLRRGLKPRQTPAGFSARVMARLPGTSRGSSFQKQRAFRHPALRWAATASVLLGVAGGSYWDHQQKERIAGERARGQLILALRISAATLNDVQHKVVKSSKGETE